MCNTLWISAGLILLSLVVSMQSIHVTYTLGSYDIYRSENHLGNNLSLKYDCIPIVTMTIEIAMESVVVLTAFKTVGADLLFVHNRQNPQRAVLVCTNSGKILIY